MTVALASEVGPSRITIAYERLGNPNDPPVLLIMGLSAQLIHWPDGFCEALVARGLHVIRFDNRDVGLSTHMHDAPAPNLLAVLSGDLSSASYTLSDMAADTAGLLANLGYDSAHIVGASMGGFIAQTLAIEHPACVRSLTSIMSSTGARNVGQPHPTAMQIFAVPPPTTREAMIERARFAAGILGSPGYPPDLAVISERAGAAYDRSFDPVGIARQGVAVIASGDRTPKLRELDVPTLVIHGAADPMCDVSGGHATAAAIPGAELVVLDGMGHDLPRQLWPELVSRIASHIERTEARKS